jgi:6-phosphogluconolactonase
MTGEQNGNIIVAADADALAETAAQRLVARIARAPGRAAVCLTGGSGPVPLYRLLAREPWRSRLPWQRVHWFMGDDRFVPVGHELSNMGAARRLLLDRVDVPPGNIHAIATDADSPDAAARLYETELKRFCGRSSLDHAHPLFDLVLMGLGPDGHTASLFPNAPALDESERWVVGVAEAGLAPFVPRVTLTFPALGSTREMLFLVDGSDKRDILEHVLAGDDLPASRARADGELVWLMDRAAASVAVQKSASFSRRVRHADF